MSNEKTLKAICGSPQNPLMIGNFPIECYVLENGTAVLSGNGMYRVLINEENPKVKNTTFFDVLLRKLDDTSLVNEDLAKKLNNPIPFIRPGRGGRLAKGYDASILKDFCDLILEARRRKLLTSDKEFRMADQVEKLLSAFALKGIEAMVYDATGYNKYKEEVIIRKLLGETVSNKLNGVIGKFPLDFYREIYRVFNWDFNPVEKGIVNKNSHVAKLTMDWIYNRMLPIPGLVDELKSVNPERSVSGKLKHYYYQYLTTDKGLYIFDTHMSSILTILKLSNNAQDTMMNINKIHPAIYRDSEYEQDLLFEEDRKHSQKAKNKALNLDSAFQKPLLL